jgi:transposase-like protein
MDVKRLSNRIVETVSSFVERKLKRALQSYIMLLFKRLQKSKSIYVDGFNSFFISS